MIGRLQSPIATGMDAMPQKKKGNEKSEKKGVRAELKPSDDRTAKTLVMMELNDVIHHEKNGRGAVILFG